VRPVPALLAEDSDREWLSSLFDAFTRTEQDLDTILAWKTRRQAKAREAGLATRIRRAVASATSPGRRLEDFFGKIGEAT
jgi:hypothetical protein